MKSNENHFDTQRSINHRETHAVNKDKNQQAVLSETRDAWVTPGRCGSNIKSVIGLSTHPGTGVDGASGRGWKLTDFLLKHV